MIHTCENTLACTAERMMLPMFPRNFSRSKTNTLPCSRLHRRHPTRPCPSHRRHRVRRCWSSRTDTTIPNNPMGSPSSASPTPPAVALGPLPSSVCGAAGSAAAALGTAWLAADMPVGKMWRCLFGLTTFQHHQPDSKPTTAEQTAFQQDYKESIIACTNTITNTNTTPIPQQHAHTRTHTYGRTWTHHQA